MKTCIIIPCYNEEKRFPSMDFKKFIKENKNIDFCLSNDGSTDYTISVLEELKKEFPDRVVIHSYKVNEGKAETVRKSIYKILQQKEYDFLGYFDADLATPLNEISRFLNSFKKNENLLLVMGTRFKRLGSNIDRRFKRFFFGRFFATIISYFILKFPVYDTQCGAKIFSTKIPISIFEEKFYTKWIFDVEILLRMKRNKNIDVYKTVLELPLLTWIEKGGSKIKFLDFLNVPFDILKLKKRYS